MNNQNVESLSPRHFKILDLCMEGWKNNEIAKHFSMTQTQVSIVVNSASFQHQLAVRRKLYEEKHTEKMINHEDEATKVLKENTVAAANRLKDALLSAKDSDAIKAADSILDRAGICKVVQPANPQSVGAVVIINSEAAAKIVETINLDNPNSQAEGTIESSDLRVVKSRTNRPQPVLSNKEK